MFLSSILNDKRIVHGKGHLTPLNKRTIQQINVLGTVENIQRMLIKMSAKK